MSNPFVFLLQKSQNHTLESIFSYTNYTFEQRGSNHITNIDHEMVRGVIISAQNTNKNQNHND